VLLLGHIDTFPGQLPVLRQNGTLSGRGTVDAKGPLCAFAAAAVSVAVPDGWRVTVVGAVEEEAATSKGARHLLTTRPAPACCVIGEPSGWDRVTLGYKGRLLAHLRLRAPFAHSAGQSALPAERAVGLWERVRSHCVAYNEGRSRAFARLDPSLRAINSRDDGAYGAVEMTLGFRLPPGLDPDTLAVELSELLAADQDGAELDLAFSGGERAHQAARNTPLVRAFLPAIREQGGEPRFVVKTGTSDMNVVGPAWGCPILAYGPGDSALDHTPEERIDLDEYHTAIGVLAGALARLMDEETPCP
jgi:LysW-gamma-L-lysine carboxypeptidase